MIFNYFGFYGKEKSLDCTPCYSSSQHLGLLKQGFFTGFVCGDFHTQRCGSTKEINGITTMDNAVQYNPIYFFWHLCLLITEPTQMAHSEQPQLPHAHPHVCFWHLPASYRGLLGGSCGCSRSDLSA